MAEDNIQLTISVKDLSSEDLKKIQRAVKDLGKEVTGWGRIFRGVGRFITGALSKITAAIKATAKAVLLLTLAFSALAAGATGALLVKSVQAAAGFEAAFTDVKKTVNETTEGFAALERGIFEMAQAIPVAQNELAGIMTVAGQLGVEGVENLLKFTRTAADLAVATVLTADEASTSLARFSNITRGSLEDVDRLGSSLVQLGNTVAANEREILNFALRLGSAATAAGFTQAEILGLSASLAEVGILAEAGGTAFSTFIIEMQKAIGSSAEAQKDLAAFSKVAGLTSDALRELIKNDPSEALLEIIRGLARVNEEGDEFFDVLEAIGIQEKRFTRAITAAALGVENFEGNIAASSKAFLENIALTIEAERRYGIFISIVQIAKNVFFEFRKRLGEPILETLTPFVEKFIEGFKEINRFLEANRDLMDEWARGVAAKITVVLDSISGFVKKVLEENKTDIKSFFDDLIPDADQIENAIIRIGASLAGAFAIAKESAAQFFAGMSKALKALDESGGLQGIIKQRIANIQSMELAILKLSDAFAPFLERIAEMRALFETIAKWIVPRFDAVWEAVKLGFFIMLKSMVDAFRDEFATLFTWFAGAWLNIRPGPLRTAIKSIFKNLTSAALGEFSTGLDTTIQNQIDAVKTATEDIPTLEIIGDDTLAPIIDLELRLKKVRDRIAELEELGVTDSLTESFLLSTEALETLGSVMGDIDFTKITEAGKKGFNNAEAALRELIDAVKNALPEAIDEAVQKAKDALDQLPRKVKEIDKVIQDGLPGFFNGMRQGFKEIFETDLPSSFDRGVEFAKTAARTISEEFGRAFGDIVSGAETVEDAMKRFFASVLNELARTIAEAQAQEFMKSISGVLGKALGDPTTEGGAGGIGAGLLSFLFGGGEDVVESATKTTEGVATELEKMAPEAKKAVAPTVPAVAGIMRQLGNVVQSGFGAIANVMIAAMGNATSIIQQILQPFFGAPGGGLGGMGGLGGGGGGLISGLLSMFMGGAGGLGSFLGGAGGGLLSFIGTLFGGPGAGFMSFANGGIVDKPTIGLLREAGRNEAVIPLPDGKNVPVTLNGASSPSGVQGGELALPKVEVNINIKALDTKEAFQHLIAEQHKLENLFTDMLQRSRSIRNEVRDIR